jgi:hypothetical protein
MEPLSEGVTWGQLSRHFDAAQDWNVSIRSHPRRTRKPLRRKGLSEERKVWRLLVQKVERCAVKTMLRKNIHYDKDDLHAQTVDPRLVARINQLIV